MTLDRLFCTKCGIKLEKDARFCIECGANIGPDPYPTSLPDITVIKQTSIPPPLPPLPAQPKRVPALVVPIVNQPIYCNQCGGVLQQRASNNNAGMLVLGFLGLGMIGFGMLLSMTVILIIIGLPMALVGGFLSGYGFVVFAKNSAKRELICPMCHRNFPYPPKPG